MQCTYWIIAEDGTETGPLSREGFDAFDYNAHFDSEEDTVFELRDEDGVVVRSWT